MESPPPEAPICLSSQGTDYQQRLVKPPSTPQNTNDKQTPVIQLPTPMSPTPNGKARLVVVLNTENVKHRLNLSDYKKTTPVSSPITQGQPVIPYDTKSRDTDMDNVKAWLATSTTVDQRRQRTNALVEALLHNCHKFTSASRGLRANGEKDPWSDSEDEDEDEDQSNNDKDDEKSFGQGGNDPFTTQSSTEKATDSPTLPLLGRVPRLNDPGIENEEDLTIIKNFRNSHNVAVVSAKCNQLVFPQLGPRPSPQQAKPVNKAVSFKIPHPSAPGTPSKQARPNHRIIKTQGMVHGPTGSVIPNPNHDPSPNTTIIPQKRSHIRNRYAKKNKKDNDTEFDPDSEKGNHRGERTADLDSGRRNPTRTTSAAGRKAARGGKGANGGRGGKRGRPIGSKNKKSKTVVSASQRGMLEAMDLDD